VGDPATSEASDLWDAILRADATDADPALISALVDSVEGGIDEELVAQMRLLGYL
jgi:hypothetical protein